MILEIAVVMLLAVLALFLLACVLAGIASALEDRPRREPRPPREPDVTAT
jgi:outer membrane lipoprotein-sorting protein